MAIASNATKGLRVGNETYLSGVESLESTNVEFINDTILAAAADQAVVMGDFEKADLVALLMQSDQDGLVRLSGGGPWVIQDIATLGDTVTRVGGTFTILLDQTAWIFPGDTFWIEGCTTPANDGLYTVIATAFAAGVTTIEVIQQLGVINVAVIEVFDTVEAGAGAACLATKIEAMGIKHDIDAGDDFTVAGAPGQFEVAEDVSWLAEFDQILIQEATSAANNQIAVVTSATFVAPDTTVVVEEAVVVEAGVAACTFMPVRSALMCRLVANIPVLWTLPSGIRNPLLEDGTTLLVSNDHATLPATFRARIVTGPV